MNRASYCLWLSAVLLLSACGGQSAGLLDGGEPLPDAASDSGPCHVVSACPSNAVWNPASCTCESGSPPPGQVPDAATACPPIVCPAGSVQGMEGNKCACIPVDASTIVDSTAPSDAPVDVSPRDAPRDTTTDQYGPDQWVPDVIYYDTPYPYDSPPYDSTIFCDPTQCGQGYEQVLAPGGGYCQCVPCTNVCPSGQTPVAGCGGCTACSQTCPAGFVYGSGCNCGPPGTDAGPNGQEGGAGTCLLQGYTACSAGAWCQLGTCPDGTTQYGCYCNQDGTANCDLTCPIPPPCTIPGQGTCAYGAQCVYGDCTGDASATTLVCSCNSGGNASCYTSTCGNVTSDGGVDSGDGGVACLLEGYVTCSAGSYCQLGTCPDNTTPYGCTCHADGTATCQLTCPAATCTIPGEGTCPLNTTCTFGTCNGSSGSRLSCYCYSGGSAYCNTVSCAAEAGAE